MAEVKIQTTEAVTEFVASDGTRFSNEDKAHKYEDFITARDEFVYARRRFRTQIAKQFVTKDGYEFTVEGLWNTDFYRIIGDQNDYPRIEKIEAWSLHADFQIHSDEYENGDLHVKISFMVETACNHCSRYAKVWKTYDPAELYRKEDNAKKALVLKLQEHAKEIERYAGTIEEKLNGK